MPDDLTTWEGLTAYVQETHRMALGLYDLIFPPWRWPRWYRTRREVLRRVETGRAARMTLAARHRRVNHA